MGLFGKIVRTINAPLKAVEEIVDLDEFRDTISKPLDVLADELDKVDKPKEPPYAD